MKDCFFNLIFLPLFFYHGEPKLLLQSVTFNFWQWWNGIKGTLSDRSQSPQWCLSLLKGSEIPPSPVFISRFTAPPPFHCSVPLGVSLKAFSAECCRNSILSAGLLHTKCVEGSTAMQTIFQVKDVTFHCYMCVYQCWWRGVWGYVLPETHY